MHFLSQVRDAHPLVVCYTNDVVKNFTANGLLSLGASPAMSEAPEEADDFFKVTSALLINIGTLTNDRGEDMLKIAKSANTAGVPVVFDPVAVGASQYRKNYCKQFLNEIDVSVIKGNASEMLALIDDNATMKGTDSQDNLDVVEIAQKAHEIFQTAIVISGEKDIIAQNGHVVELSNGTPMFTKITGAGCLLGAVVASFLLGETQPSITQLEEAVSYYNIAAEHALLTEGADLPGTFLVRFIDELNQVTAQSYQSEIKKREVS
ncbi:hydroxyethylthiazole kinase [Staphylococcus canis]|uniref:Hydroxyethylthiazole kinase n=1 Tax=Staphylococcus canis TaxID=2724942 RepID=A0ABS0TA04_9STAP|nr:hydroxyethylthiazole kinase [Staphylococcus canis]MBI5975507.1 hydroxyethylthiazole kinase [Staphylococcus canis]